MRKTLLGSILLVSAMALLPVDRVGAQSAYFQAVTNLNPTAYWPMHETTAPLVGNVETNYGSVGVLGNAYFGDWESSTSAVTRQVTGALVNDPNPALTFSGARPSFLLVPHTSPATTLAPPFTIECWMKASSTGFGDIVAQAGATLNGAGNDGNKVGIRLLWQGNNSAGPSFQVFVGTGTGQTTIQATTGFVINQWYYLVLTADIQGGSTNFTLYVDGNQAASGTSVMVPTTWNPLTIGGGWWDTKGFPWRLFPGSVDEVAIYTNVLDSTAIASHMSAGTSGAAGAYFAAVQASQPLLYYHMDAPPYVEPDPSTWPVMGNKGSTGGDGVYRPGLRIGAVSGPGSFCAGFGADVNAMPLNGMSTFGIAPYVADYNVAYNAADPGSDTPFSISAWFKGNPTDSREQRLVSHGTNSWGLRVSTTGIIRLETGASTNLPGPMVNDSKWHHVVATHTGTNNAIYLDGVLAASGANKAFTNGPGSTLPVYIGGDPFMTNIPLAVGQQFAGSVCDVAFWNGTALSLANVKTLYGAAGVPPTIITQPVSASVNMGSAFTNTVVAAGGEPLVYQWYQNGASRSGQTSASLVLNPVQLADSGNWYVVVTNSYGSATSSIVSLTVIQVPTIIQQPVNPSRVLFAGGHASMSIVAAGQAPLSYQWLNNSVAVAGATNASFTLSNAATGTFSYQCRVTNTLGSTLSAAVSVSVVARPTAPYPAAVLADKPLDYWRLNEPDNGLGNGNPGVIAHDYWGGDNGTYTNVNLAQSGYSTSTDPADTSAQFGSFFSPESYAGNIQGVDFAATDTSVNFSVEAWVNGDSGNPSGNSAGIVSKGFGGGGEQFCIDYNNAANGIRFLVRDSAGTVVNCNSGVSPNGAWHHVVGVCNQSSGLVSLYVDGVLKASGGITPGNGIQTNSGPMVIGSRKSAQTSTTYNNQFRGLVDEVAVYGYALTARQVLNHYTAAGTPPIISQAPPAAVTVGENAPLTVSATVAGTPPITVTWLDPSGATIGQTTISGTNSGSSTLNISSVPLSWSGLSLQMAVANAYGSSATSPQVTLNVVSGAPQFAQDLPASTVVAAGKVYTYTVAMLGTAPFSYQWYSNDVVLAGQTGPTYTFMAASGNYRVTVSNGSGSTNSTTSALRTVSYPTSGYASAILGANPVGYWPLQETATPAPVTLETNLGTVGVTGNAYYAAGVSGFSQGGALAPYGGDPDASVAFNGTVTSFAFVPRKSPKLTVEPPFSLECWMMPVGGNGTADLLAEGGSGLNSAANAGDFAGFRMSFGGGSGDGDTLQFFAYNGSGGAYNIGNTNIQTPAASIARGVWNYCVATYDGTNVALYVNGVLLQTGVTTMALDTWSPITLGGGRWQGINPTRRFNGLLDEVAIYTNVLSPAQILNHYTVATTAANYKQAVLNEHPALYYRLDCPAYLTPDPVTYPTAVNYGSAAPNGAYVAGIVPGGVAGPSFVGIGNLVAAPINGNLSCVDAGYDPAFDPAGTQPFTVLAWFKGYPADGRVQTIMSHGANWAMNLDGTTGHVVWNLYSGGQVTSSGILNDGSWHMLAGVSDGTTSSLYVDGALDNSAPLTGGMLSAAGTNVFLGGSADYVAVGSNQRYLAGAIAQAAVFTNALAAAQIASLYTLAKMPTITLAPVGSQLVITYTGTLLSSPTVDGTYLPVLGATSPYTVPQGDVQRFYRTRNP